MRDPHHQDYDDQHHSYQDEYYEEPLQPRRLDPAVEKVRRKLMRLMLVSVLITILLVGAVLFAVIYKVTRPAKDADVQPLAQNDVLNQPATPTNIPEAQSGAENQALAVKPKPAEVIEDELDLPLGTRILSQSLSGDLISLETIAPSGGTELVIYNYREGRIIARLTIPANDLPTPDTDDKGN